MRLAVRLTPKAARDRIEGIDARPDGTYLAASVRAVPAKGAANEALLRLVAEWLGVPKRDVTLAAGGQSRYKQVDIAGEAAGIETLLRQALAQSS